VEDRVAALERGLERLLVEDVSLDDVAARRGLDALDEAALPRDEAVVDDDLEPLGQQPVGEVAPDEAGPAGDEDPLQRPTPADSRL
jgi:hypothetical protein